MTLPGAFAFAAGLVVVAVIAMFFLAPETTGKDLQD